MTSNLEFPSSCADFSQLARVADRLLTPVAVVDIDSTIRYANNVAAGLFDAAPSELVGRKALTYVHPDDRERVATDLNVIGNAAGSGGFAEFRYRSQPREAWRSFRSYAHNLIDDPDVRGILFSGTDVTEQDRTTRALRTLSACNRVLIHATDEAALVDNVCRSITESGEYMLAWVGYLNQDEGKTVRPVSAHGEIEYLSGVHISWADDEFGRGPTGAAIRTRSPQVVTDHRRSKKCQPWRDRIDTFGVRTSCAFPLIVGDASVGSLTIYSRDLGAFGPAEMDLFGELANNLAYGIGRLRDAERLARNEAHLREAERLAHVGHWEWNLRTDEIEFMADEAHAIYGVADPEWRGDYRTFLSFVAADDRSAFHAAMELTLTSGTAELSHRVLACDGEVRVIRMRTELVTDKDGVPERVVGVSLDDTVYVAARRELDESRLFLLAITNNMAEGMIATDNSGTITFANAAAGKLFHLDSNDIIGKRTGDVFHFKCRGRVTDDEETGPLHRVWNGGESLNFTNETVIRRDGTQVPVAFSASPLNTDALDGAVIVFEDITAQATEQLKVQRELEKLAWVGRVRDALDNDRFVLYSQPIVDLSTYEVEQHELLIRMVTPEGDVVLPSHFLPTAEEYGLVAEMDRWVVSETARLAADGHAVEFNLSAKSVADPHMLSVIQEAIREFGAPPQNMVCEITETALVHDIAAAESFVRGLNDLGCRVALDDFGAGYGGFAYLKRLPVSYLKIDQQFVRDLCAEESSRHVISAVVNLAKAFGMKTIAEGAEDDATLRLLKDLGVDHVQGFVIGRPSLARDALEGAATAHATSRSHHGARVTTTSHD
jgi:PAS domain S-box-containing protein